jgi:hypothetical protein
MPMLWRMAQEAPLAHQKEQKSRRLWPTIAGIAIFSALMGLRPELHSVWARAAVAGCAGAALGLGIYLSPAQRSR